MATTKHPRVMRLFSPETVARGSVFLGRLRAYAQEFLVQREAEARARSLDPPTAKLVSEQLRAVDTRMQLVGDTSEPNVALMEAAVLRDVVILLFETRRVVTAAAKSADAQEELRDVCEELAIPLSTYEAAAVLLANDTPIARDRLPRQTLVDSARALEQIIRLLRARLDGRSPRRIVWSRRVRLVLASAIATYVVVVATRAITTPPNIARGKPVTLSSLDARGAPPANLVDGVRSGDAQPSSPKPDVVMTHAEHAPWALIDLETTAIVRQVRVYNRDDIAPLTMGGSPIFENGLPYRVELSLDGAHFWEIGQCATHFGSWWGDPPCKIVAEKQRARYVRVSATNTLALSEIEVLAW